MTLWRKFMGKQPPLPPESSVALWQVAHRIKSVGLTTVEAALTLSGADAAIVDRALPILNRFAAMPEAPPPRTSTGDLTEADAKTLMDSFRTSGVWPFGFPLHDAVQTPYVAYFAIRELTQCGPHFEDAVPRLAGIHRYYLRAAVPDTLAMGWLYIWADRELGVMRARDYSPRASRPEGKDVFWGEVFAANGVYTLIEYEAKASDLTEGDNVASVNQGKTRSLRFAVLRERDAGVFEGHAAGPGYGGKVVVVREEPGEDELLAQDFTERQPRMVDLHGHLEQPDRLAAALFGLPERKGEPAKS